MLELARRLDDRALPRNVAQRNSGRHFPDRPLGNHRQHLDRYGRGVRLPATFFRSSFPWRQEFGVRFSDNEKAELLTYERIRVGLSERLGAVSYTHLTLPTNREV